MTNGRRKDSLATRRRLSLWTDGDNTVTTVATDDTQTVDGKCLRAAVHVPGRRRPHHSDADNGRDTDVDETLEAATFKAATERPVKVEDEKQRGAGVPYLPHTCGTPSTYRSR